MSNILTFDLKTLRLQPGLYNIQVKATSSTGSYKASDFSNSIYFQSGHAVAISYPTGTHNAPEYVDDATFAITLIPNPGQYVPTAEEITVRGASYSYSTAENTGTLTISGQTGDIGITIGSEATLPVATADNKLIVSNDNYYLLFADEE